MKAHAAAAGRRLALGTGRAFEWLGWWLGAGDRTPARHTLRADTAWLGVVLRRLLLLLFAALFYVGVLYRAPYLIYAAPVVWAVAAWQMSDWSATPPPEEGHPSCNKCAGQQPVSVTPSETRKGMMIYGYALTDRPGHTHVHLSSTPGEGVNGS